MLWVEAAVAEMSDPPADFMGLIWPIGEALDDDPDPEIFDGAHLANTRMCSVLTRWKT